MRTDVQILHPDGAPFAARAFPSLRLLTEKPWNIHMSGDPGPPASSLLLARVNNTPGKEERMMKRRTGTVILAGALAAVMALPMTATCVYAGRGGATGQGLSTQSRSKNQVRNRYRLRDGSCLDPAKQSAGNMQKKGNTYGPGDGTGNMGDRPTDGTGYGAPSRR